MPKPLNDTAKLVAAILASGAFAAGAADAAHATVAGTSSELLSATGRVRSGLAPFADPARITNSWLPLSVHREAVLLGDDDGHAVRTVRTRLGHTWRFRLPDQAIRAAVIEDQSYRDGALRSTVRSYFAQADDGTVYRIAAEIDRYDATGSRSPARDLTSIEGRTDRTLTVAMPATPRDGQRFWSTPSNTAAGLTRVIDTNARLTVPIGSFNRVLVVHATPTAGGASEVRYYARGTGLIKQQRASGAVELASLS